MNTMQIMISPETSPDSKNCLFWYDGPLLWYGPIKGRAKDVNGVGLAMAVSDCSEGVVYIVIKVSPRRLAAILAGSITIREAFRFSERRRWRMVLSKAGWNECTP